MVEEVCEQAYFTTREAVVCFFKSTIFVTKVGVGGEVLDVLKAGNVPTPQNRGRGPPGRSAV